MYYRTSRKRLKAKRIKRQSKISWQKLGLETFVREKLPTPIEEIRREVLRLARQGMRLEVRPVSPVVRATNPVRRKRRGAIK